MLSFLKELLEVPQAEQPSVDFNEREEPVYGDSDVPAVGARRLTLGEAVDALLVYQPGRSEPVAVQVPLSALVDHPELAPVLNNGSRIEAEPESLIQVDYFLWQEYAEQVVGLWLPERDADGVDRVLATAVREHRLAQHEADVRSSVRNCLVVLVTRLGRSRRDVAELADLSVTRVQQLIEDPPREVIEFIRTASLIAGLLGDKPCPREEVPRPRHVDTEELDDVIDLMLAVGLLEEDASGLRLTRDGTSLRDFGEHAPRARRGRKRTADGERAGDADR